ncbi:hypothetical protein IU487_22200 [Nocardia puris]|uniref:hypothetical protein n=1 Tax=Nocardia puris TaxID=208602 RepID=UPI001893781F|nr:hypothetical protein [Nocardia puris]MBF6213732.1 hypothetical protein [Nocardia puris]
MAGQMGLPGLDAGRRTERREYRVVVAPGTRGEWSVSVPGATMRAARRVAADFVVPTRIEERVIVTYTTGWEPAATEVDQ